MPTDLGLAHRIEDDFKERMNLKAKAQAAIERARQKNEALYVRLSSREEISLPIQTPKNLSLMLLER
ncbi:hypothetical protein EV421DRAFT_1910032 [Armillaria borealis]|uniref:Uncharacterized protein n=1 Tax=Armillaria borealis TaxID=47425 RepID=A0AA39MG24_9AGAR|nr:hypothetical protein EV421DRAFT_1910032 [Armillaria borealis]